MKPKAKALPKLSTIFITLVGWTCLLTSYAVIAGLLCLQFIPGLSPWLRLLP